MQSFKIQIPSYELEMEDLGKTKYCLGLQLEHCPLRILLHQSAYIQKILEKFNMDKSYRNKIPMVVRSLEIEKDPFRPRDIGENMLGSRFHILVSLEHLCILQIAQGLISHLQ
jgi:hypothetical protein